MFSNRNTSFGGFGGSNSTTGSPFGASTANKSSPFGNTSNLFGGFGSNTNANTNTNTNSLMPFGQSSGFGNNNTGGFGSNSGFGTLGSAFGQNQTQSGFGTSGGFGSTTNTGFGASNNSGGIFGNSSSFGGGFGKTQNTQSPFGATSGGFSGAGANNGTAGKAYAPLVEKDTTGTSYFNNICAMPEYKGFSPAELRMKDYEQNRKVGSAQGGIFGNSGGFGQKANTGMGFGQLLGFGQSNSGFGSTGAFGQNNNTSIFGQNQNQNQNQTQNQGAGFGQNTSSFGFGNKTGTGFGQTTSAFGGTNNMGTNNMGNNMGSTMNNQSLGFLFGSGSAFGNNNNTNTSTGFGNTASPFGGTNNNNTSTGFGANATQANPFKTGSGFGTSGGFGATNSSPFGTTNNTSTATNNTFGKPGGLFGSTNTGFGNSGGFGTLNNTNSGGLFGSTNTNNNTNTNTNTGLFGNNNNNTSTGTGLFGNNNNTSTNTNTLGGLFGSKPATGGLFGLSAATNNTQSMFNKPTTFGSTAAQPAAPATNSLFSQPQQPAQPNFGSLQDHTNRAQQALTSIAAQNPYGEPAFLQSITRPQQGLDAGPQAVMIKKGKKPLSLGSVHRLAPLFTHTVEVAPKKATAIVPVLDVDAAIMALPLFSDNEHFKQLVIRQHAAKEEAEPKRVLFVTEKAPEMIEGTEQDGYWLLPSLGELKTKTKEELKSVELTVGRRLYGEIRFLKPVDLSLVDLDSLFGQIVVFGSCKVTLFPEDDVPPAGEGLNQPAEITLEGCFPIDGKTRLAVRHPDPETVERHTEMLKKAPETEFESYDATLGTWRFRVLHI